MVGSEAAASSNSPRSKRRSASTRGRGQEERFAIVRFLTLPFSRNDSRSRMAGGEFRLGTQQHTCRHNTHVMSLLQYQLTYLHDYINKLRKPRYYFKHNHFTSNAGGKRREDPPEFNDFAAHMFWPLQCLLVCNGETKCLATWKAHFDGLCLNGIFK
jgi:hypothetical protein